MKRTSWRNTAFSRAPVVRIYNEYPDLITQPVTIALITDLHSTRYGRRQEVLVHALRKYNPDLILLAGDIVDDQVPLVGTREFLEGIRTLPFTRCFYVTGNHEQRTGRLDAIKKRFTSHGVTVLSGETRTVNIRGQLLEIGGVDDPTVFTPNRFVRRIPRQWERQLADCRAGLSGERLLHPAHSPSGADPLLPGERLRPGGGRPRPRRAGADSRFGAWSAGPPPGPVSPVRRRPLPAG